MKNATKLMIYGWILFGVAFMIFILVLSSNIVIIICGSDYNSTFCQSQLGSFYPIFKFWMDLRSEQLYIALPIGAIGLVLIVIGAIDYIRTPKTPGI